MAVIEFKNESNVTEYHVNDISSYEGFDSLVEFFTSIERGSLLRETKGPGTRIAEIAFDGIKIKLVFSDQIGNYFFPIDSSGFEKAKKLAKSLEKRIEEFN